MKRLIVVVFMVLLTLTLGVAASHFAVTGFVPASSFSDRITTVTHKGERYHVIPESTLENDVILIVDKKGMKYYILSEEKLRLLGPKLLTGGE